MKKILIATVATITVIASPAFAQHAWRAPANPSGFYGWTAPEGAYAQQYRRTYSVNPRYDAYDARGYVGSDPDPRVRQMLENDHEYDEE